MSCQHLILSLSLLSLSFKSAVFDSLSGSRHQLNFCRTLLNEYFVFVALLMEDVTATFALSQHAQGKLSSCQITAADSCQTIPCLILSIYIF